MTKDLEKINNFIFLTQPKQLLKLWKELRSSLDSEKTDIEHLKEVVEFWKHAPIGPRSINWDQPDQWPDPWQLMHEREFDESSIAIGMFYTLLLSADQRWDSSRLGLLLINDSERKIQRLVLLVDKKLVMNLDYGTITDLSRIKNAWIQQKYAYDGKTHHLHP
jgi:hypothetical protein